MTQQKVDKSGWWYYELHSFGKWVPEMAPNKPAIDDGRIKKMHGRGKRIRRVVQVGDLASELTLSEMQHTVDTKRREFEECGGQHWDVA